jgi:hypothetical protein
MTHMNIFTDWCTASTEVGTGFDSRSSNNGLLTIMYGSLERAHHFNWLNAGRTLVDKTYIQLLWQAKQLPAIGVTHHDIALQLELFIRENLQPIWPDIEQMTAVKKQALATHLVNLAASTLFGSSHQAQAASWFLFYLCPQLPIFPINDSLRDALIQKHTITSSEKLTQAVDCYNGYRVSAQALYEKLLPLSHCTLPTVNYGNVKEQAIIKSILVNSDWWERHCFLHYLLALKE